MNIKLLKIFNKSNNVISYFRNVAITQYNTLIIWSYSICPFRSVWHPFYANWVLGLILGGLGTRRAAKSGISGNLKSKFIQLQSNYNVRNLRKIIVNLKLICMLYILENKICLQPVWLIFESELGKQYENKIFDQKS